MIRSPHISDAIVTTGITQPSNLITDSLVNVTGLHFEPFRPGVKPINPLTSTSTALQKSRRTAAKFRCLGHIRRSDNDNDVANV